MSADYFTARGAKDSRTQSLDHPGSRIPGQNGIGSFKAVHPRLDKTEPGVVAWMAKHKNKINTRQRELPQAFSNEPASDSQRLIIRMDSEGSEYCRGRLSPFLINPRL